MDVKGYISARLIRYAQRLGTSMLKVVLAVVFYCLGSMMLRHAMPALMFLLLYLVVCGLWQIHREIKLFNAAQTETKLVAATRKTLKVRAF